MRTHLHRVLGWAVMPVLVLLVVAGPVTVFLLGLLLPLFMVIFVALIILGGAWGALATSMGRIRHR